MSNKSHSWSDLAKLTHATQIKEFGFCPCEDFYTDAEKPYDDCPKEPLEW